MDSSSVLAQFRADVVDEVEPHLWSDAEVFGYIDDAQKMFCRLTGGLGDTSSSVSQINYVVGVNKVALSPLILKFRAAYHSVNQQPVEVLNFEDLASRCVRLDNRAGHPRYIVIGMEENTGVLYPTPIDSGMIQLMIDRLPLKTINDEDQKLEVADQHKRGLLLWVKAQAYSKQDAETLDRLKQQEFDSSFRRYCADAKAEKERRMHKTRIVAYGGY